MTKMRYTFVTIMLLLTGLLGVWWHQSYQRDKAQLRDRVERDLDDLLINEVFRKAVPYFMKDGPVWEGGSQEERVKRNKVYLNYSLNELRRNTKVLIEHYPEPTRFNPFPHPTIIERSIEAYSGNRPKSITILAKPFKSDSQSLTFHFQDDGFTLENMPFEVLDTISERYGVNLRKVGAIGVLNSTATHDRTMRVKSELVNKGPKKDPTYFEVIDYRSTILLGLLPELFFGFLLFGATGFAFATAYRNLFEQEKQLRQKDALVANVAHELKTPIATVGVALEALTMFGADADAARRREYLAIGQSELQRLDQMADRAIDSLQAGQDLAQRIRPRRTDLTTAVRDAWRGLALRYQLPESSLKISTYGSVEAEVDPHYWHHLVYNLLDNACKYGGTPPEIEVVIAGRPGETVITFTDNGPGIPRYEREHVFERFYRIYRPGEGHAVKGHGLGLTFVRQVARAHGGTVEVDDAESGGARFTVKLVR